MKNIKQSNKRTFLIFIILFGVLSITINNYSFAKKKNMERLKTMKKVRLLEYLNLPTAKSDKFLVKFNEFEQKHENISNEIRTNINELRIVLDENSTKNSSVIKDNISKLNKLQNDMIKLSQEEDNEMKTLLDDVEYAKYLVFKMGFRDMAMEKLEEYRENMEKYKENMERYKDNLKDNDNNRKKNSKRDW